MLLLIIDILLLVLAFNVLVPAITNGGVKTRGGLVAGFLNLVLIGLANMVVWSFLSAVAPGGFVGTSALAGLVIVTLVSGFSILVVGRLLPGLLYVRGFGSAVAASLVMGFAALVIAMITMN